MGEPVNIAFCFKAPFLLTSSPGCSTLGRTCFCKCCSLLIDIHVSRWLYPLSTPPSLPLKSKFLAKYPVCSLSSPFSLSNELCSLATSTISLSPPRARSPYTQAAGVPEEHLNLLPSHRNGSFPFSYFSSFSYSSYSDSFTLEKNTHEL